MPVSDRSDIIQAPTVPDSPTQRPVFGAITETVKDAFVLELRQYLETEYDKVRQGELPRIDKYSVSGDVQYDPLETAVNLIRAYPDLTENLPIIAVTSTTGRNLKLSISDKFTSMTVAPAKVASSQDEPYALTDGMDLELSTQPDGTVASLRTSRFIFKSFMFADIGAATAAEVARAINFQSLYSTAHVTTVNGNNRVSIRAGGPHGKMFPNKITVVGGTSVTPLGLSVAQTDQNYGAGKVAYDRYHTAADLTVSIEIMAESENVRTDLTDIVYGFFAYVLADRKYQFYGRSTFDDTILDETYQIIIKDGEFSFAGDNELPRPSDQKDKIYVSRITVPVTAIQYSDRIISNSDGTAAAPAININIINTFDLPEPN